MFRCGIFEWRHIQIIFLNGLYGTQVFSYLILARSKTSSVIHDFSTKSATI